MADLAQQQKRNKLLTKPAVICLLALLSCALWGSAFPVIKIGYTLWGVPSGDYASQILFAGIRFTFAGVLTLIAGSLISKKALLPKRGSIRNIFVLSLFQTVLQYIFFYIGLARTTGTKSSVINGVGVFFSVLLVTVVLKQEKFTAPKALGCALGFGGVVLINLNNGGIDGGFSFFGEGFIILSALSYAISGVLIKSYSRTESPVTLSGFQFFVGGIVMTLFGLALGGRLSGGGARGIILLAYLAFLSACAYTVWGILLKYNPVSGVTVYSFMTPVFGCIMSALMLGESLKGSAVNTLISLILVCAGIFLVNRKNKYTEKSYES